MTESTMQDDKPNGPVAAVLLGGGLGAAALGLTTTISESNKAIASVLNWYNPSGPLTGKASIAVAAFFVSWLLLHVAFREKNVNFTRVSVVAFVLLGIGLLGTFPPFFEIFSGN